MKNVFALIGVVCTPLFAQGPPAEAVPIGPIAITILAVAGVGYGIYRIAKKK